MKLTKHEKWWLGTVVLLYMLYNLPGVPGYGSARGALIHAALTLVPLWIAVYVGMAKVFRDSPLKEAADASQASGEANEMDAEANNAEASTEAKAAGKEVR